MKSWERADTSPSSPSALVFWSFAFARSGGAPFTPWHDWHSSLYTSWPSVLSREAGGDERQ
jgi:hypothetical protein